MKNFIFLISIFLITGCSDSNSKPAEDKPAIANNNSNISSSAMQDEDIIGEWEQVGFIVDTNDNLQIDEEERKDLKPMSYKDYMKLNSDGSGLFTVARLEGRYEAKAKQSGEKRTLTWYDSANGEHRVGIIIKVTKDELHIKEPDGHGLFLWKRI